LPPLAWQTYDIDFTAAKYDDSGKKTANAKITVKHNGVTIHENLELPAGTQGGRKEGPEKLGLFLQNHNNPVAFRNIWAVEK
jgi:3-keto-disaccharide hydrolase